MPPSPPGSIWWRRRCARSPVFSQGVVRATDVMFPNGSMALVERFYKDNPIGDSFNGAPCRNGGGLR